MTDATATGLLPCECGREPSIYKRRPLVEGRFQVVSAWVECRPCDAAATECATVDEAIAAWNRRTPTGDVA